MLCKEPMNVICPDSENLIDDNLRSQLRNAKELNFCIVVHCTKKLPTILLLAKEYGLLGPRYRWFSTTLIETNQIFKDLPENILCIETTDYNKSSKLGHTGCGQRSYMNDGLMLVASLRNELGTDFAKHPQKR